MSETFGRYTVISQLGKGAMGVVYLASDPMLNRQVAVKTVDLSIQEPKEREFLRERLLRDARAAAVLKHPNIVAIYDVFEDAGHAYVVMEYIEGDSLAARLRIKPMPDASETLKVLGQMADALDYTHAKGVIHRDIKPANVMIDSTGATKIMDFGIARIMDTRTVTPTGMVMGTVEYMAPEQVLGEAADGRADQFAVAVVAYQMMTGSTLFGPQTLATLAYKVVNEAAPPPSTRNSALPPGVDAVLAKGLSKKPADRFVTCTAFVGALAQAFANAPTAPLAVSTQSAALRSQPTVDLPASTPVAAMAPARQSHAPVIAAAIVVVLLTGALAAVIFKPWTHFQHPPAATSAAVAPPVTAPPEPVKTATPAEKAPIETTKPVEPAKAAEPPKAGSLKSEPAKTEPAKPEPAKSEAPKTEVIPPPPPPKVAKVPEISEPVAASAPVDEVGALVLPKESKPSPFLQALQHGQQQVKAQDYTGALHSFGDAVQLRPTSAQAHYSRGTVFQHFEQYDPAMRDYNDAIRLEPSMVTAYVGLGTCLAHEHRDPEALVQFQKALALNADAPMAHFGVGNVYYRRKQFGAALAEYDKVLKTNPRYAPAYLNRAKAREAIGDLAGAAADRRIEQSLRK